MSDYFDRVERQIVRNVEAGLPRASRLPAAFQYLAPAAAVLVAVAVAAVFLVAHGSSPSPVPSTGHNGVTVELRAAAINPQTPIGPAIDRSVRILRERLVSVYPGVQVSRSGDDIVVVAPKPGAGVRARVLALAAPGRLAFYDWEADALTPNGKTVASQLRAGNQAALAISQGSGSSAPGGPGDGAMPFRQAAALASKHPGYVVVQAVGQTGPTPSAAGTRGSWFYVLRNVPFLTGAGINDPHELRDTNTGTSGVSFGFTKEGAAEFEAGTKRVARRGALVSGLGQTLNQHFAVAVDDQLISVPYIDFQQYPDGVPGNSGAELSGNFTVQSARDLATLLRFGPLPVELTAMG